MDSVDDLIEEALAKKAREKVESDPKEETEVEIPKVTLKKNLTPKVPQGVPVKKKQANKKALPTPTPAGAPKEEIVEASTIRVERTFFKGGSLIKEESEEAFLDVHKFVVEPTRVYINYGRTIPMEQFASCKLSLGISIPCYFEEKDEAFEYGANWAGERMDEEMQAIEEFKNKSKR